MISDGESDARRSLFATSTRSSIETGMALP
jgi:hypothetical protein